MDIVSQHVCQMALNKATTLLYHELSRTDAALDRLEEKLDVVVNSSYRTAIRHLEESANLVGDNRHWKLREALRLFEESDDRNRMLVDKSRSRILKPTLIWSGEGGSSFEMDSWVALFTLRWGRHSRIGEIEKGFLIYETLNAHFELEYMWLLHRLGSLRVAVELGSNDLISVKTHSLDDGVDNSLQYMRSANTKLDSMDIYGDRIGGLFSLAYAAVRRPFYFSPDHYYLHARNRYSGNLDKLSRLKMRGHA